MLRPRRRDGRLRRRRLLQRHRDQLLDDIARLRDVDVEAVQQDRSKAELNQNDRG
jgi:hypothetical protein